MDNSGNETYIVIDCIWAPDAFHYTMEKLFLGCTYGDKDMIHKYWFKCKVLFQLYNFNDDHEQAHNKKKVRETK